MDREFFARPSVEVAKALLGKILTHHTKEGITKGIIVEVEAYCGINDPACHSYKNKKTKKNELLWKSPGYAYIYMVHRYCMLNIVTEKEGVPSSVFIRAVEPLEGIEIMKNRRGINDIKNLTNGPGKLTQAFGITMKNNGADIINSNLRIEKESSSNKFEIISTPRIGVKDKAFLRFYIKENKFVSFK